MKGPGSQSPSSCCCHLCQWLSAEYLSTYWVRRSVTYCNDQCQLTRAELCSQSRMVRAAGLRKKTKAIFACSESLPLGATPRGPRPGVRQAPPLLPCTTKLELFLMAALSLTVNWPKGHEKMCKTRVGVARDKVTVENVAIRVDSRPPPSVNSPWHPPPVIKLLPSDNTTPR